MGYCEEWRVCGGGGVSMFVSMYDACSRKMSFSSPS